MKWRRCSFGRREGEVPEQSPQPICERWMHQEYCRAMTRIAAAGFSPDRPGPTKESGYECDSRASLRRPLSQGVDHEHRSILSSLPRRQRAKHLNSCCSSISFLHHAAPFDEICASFHCIEPNCSSSDQVDPSGSDQVDATSSENATEQLYPGEAAANGQEIRSTKSKRET